MRLLVESAIKSSLIVLLGLAILPLLRRRAAAVRHWVLAATLVCAAAAPVVTLALPSWQLPVKWPSTVASSPVWRAPATIGASIATVSRPDRERRHGDSFAVTTVLYRSWIAGVVVSALLLLVGLARLRYLALHAVPIREGVWVERAQEISRQYGVRQPLLFQTRHPTLLVTWGVRRPRIPPPSRVRAWSKERIRMVLSHRSRAPRRLAGHARCGTALRRLLVQPHRVVRVPASPPGERAGLRRRGVERWCGRCGLCRTSGGNRARTAAQTAQLGACAVDLTGVNARKESQGHARSASQPSSDHSFGRRRDAAGGGAADDSSHERRCRPDVHHDVRVDCRSDQWSAGWRDPGSYQYSDQGQVRSPQRPFGPLRIRGPAGGRLRTRGHAARVRGVQRKADRCRTEPAAGFQARRRLAHGDDQHQSQRQPSERNGKHERAARSRAPGAEV